MQAAKLIDNIVVQIIEGSAEWANSRLGGDWIEIQENTVAIGYSYDHNTKLFTAPQPYPSWQLDSNNIWQAPIAKPTDSIYYNWDESILNWKKIEL